MQTSKINNVNSNDEIDLRKIFITLRQIIRILSNSKKIVIVTTLVGLLIAFSYVHQRGPKYESQAALEIGAKIIQDYKLVNYLNIHLDFAKKLGNVEAVRTKDSFIKLTSVSASDLESKNMINETLTFIAEYIERKILIDMEKNKNLIKNVENTIISKNDKKRNKILNEIERNKKLILIHSSNFALDKEILKEKSSARIALIDISLKRYEATIADFENEISKLKEKINLIGKLKTEESEEFMVSELQIDLDQLEKKLIPSDLLPIDAMQLFELRWDAAQGIYMKSATVAAEIASQTAVLEQVIFGYKSQIHIYSIALVSLLQEKINLKGNLKSEESEDFMLSELKIDLDQLEKKLSLFDLVPTDTMQLFELRQEKNILEIQLKSIEDKKISNLLVDKIRTNQINSTSAPYFFGAIFGLIFSFIIIFFREVNAQED